MYYYTIQIAKQKSEAEVERVKEEMRAAALNKQLKEREADIKNLHLVSTCVNSYKASMQKDLSQSSTNVDQAQLQEFHKNAKQEAKQMV